MYGYTVNVRYIDASSIGSKLIQFNANPGLVVTGRPFTMSVYLFFERKERGGSRKKLEVEMDSLVEGDNGGDVSEEKMPLTRNLRNNGRIIVLK